MPPVWRWQLYSDSEGRSGGYRRVRHAGSQERCVHIIEAMQATQARLDDAEHMKPVGF